MIMKPQKLNVLSQPWSYSLALLLACSTTLSSVAIAQAKPKKASTQQALCSATSLGSYYQNIQGNRSISLEQAKKLVECHSQQTGDEVAFWTAFYYDYNQDQTSKKDFFRQYINRVKSKPSTDALLQAARLGNSKSLAEAIYGAEPQYTQSLIHHLTYARVLSWQREFELALQAYDDFLNLARKSDKGEIEKLYVMIWKGDIRAAKAYHAKLSSYNNSRWQNAALSQAKIILEDFEQKQRVSKKKSSSKGSSASGTLKASLTSATENTGSEKMTIMSSFKSKYVIVKADHFQKEADSDTKSEGGSSFAAGGHYETKSWSSSALLGYFSLADDPLLYELSGKWHDKGSYAGLSLTRKPLAHFVIPHGDAATTRQSLSLELGAFHAYAHFNFHDEDDSSPWENYLFGYKRSLDKGQRQGEGLSIDGHFSYEKRTKPSSQYDTLGQKLGVGAAVEYGTPIGFQNLFLIHSGYDSFQVKTWDGSEDNDQEFFADLKIQRELDETSHYFIGYYHWQRFNNNLGLDVKSRNHWQLGLNLGL